MVNNIGLFVPKIAKKPWDIYETFKEHGTDKTSVDDLTNKILNVANVRVDMACCIALIYLTGSRIREVLQWKYVSKYSEEAKALGFNIIKQGFELQQLSFYKDENGKIWWNFKTINLKQNSKKSEGNIDARERFRQIQKINYKEIRLPAFGDLPDFRMIQLLDVFFDDVLHVYRDDIIQVMEKAKPDTFFSPFKESCLTNTPFIKMRHPIVYHYIKNYLGMSPHNLRELRMQYLLRYYKFEIQDLQLAGGWAKSSNMPLRYTKAKIKNMQDKFNEAIRLNPI